MFLKRLELKGFKSFPEKTVLEFDRGITAVVGPNGSGKSNISDAVRWVLGEQSVKNLRGSNKMEDVIFAGTQNRTKLGFAEVSMVVDNTDNSFDLPYSEVVVTRRLYRSGESEFAINGSLCRLRDIHELFMDTGIGREGYSIIGQGRIDEILSIKSEDRRMIFEEAAGIVKFKSRRFEAEKKLEKEKQNLIRINDVIYELESQAEPLKSQAEKTKKYLVLTDRLKVVQINLFLFDIEKINNQTSENEKNISSVDIEIAESEKKSPLFEELKIKLKNKIENNSLEIEKVNAELSELRSESEQTENDIKFILQHTEYLNKNISDFQNQINELEKSINNKREEININNLKKKSALFELESKNKELEKLQADFESVLSEIGEKEEIINNYNSEIINKMSIRSDIKVNIESINVSLSQTNERKEQIKNEIDYSLSQKNDKQVRLSVLKKSMEELEIQNIELNNKINTLCDEKNKKEEIINELYKNRGNINITLNDFSSKFKILSELEKDYEGYYDSVKTVLKQRENGNPLFSGIRGAVGELLSVDENYEAAIEAALGGSVQNIVTKDENDAGKAIDYLKKTKKGRATFLPMNAIKGREISQNLKSQILNEKGVIDFAENIISYSSEYKNIFSNLLGKVIVLDSFDNAANFARKYNYSYKIVTLGGELFNPGGSITGGSINKKSAGIFSRNREIKKLRQKIEEYTITLDKVDKDISILKDEINDTNTSIENIRDSLNKISIKKNDLENQITNTKENLKNLSDKYDSLIDEEKTIENQILEQNQKLSSFEIDFNNIEKEIEEIQSYLNKYQSEVQSGKDIREENSKKVTEIKLEITESEFKISSLDSDIKRINSEISSENLKIVKNKDNIQNAKNEISEKQKQITLAENKNILIKKKSEKNQNDIKMLNEKRKELSSESEKLEKESLEHIEYTAKIKNEKTRLELLRERLEERKSTICADIWERYEVTIASAQKYERLDIDISKLRLEESKLKDTIRKMGTVNVNAVEEYERVMERYNFLSNQRQDVLHAEENLKNIISELSELMENQFREQFKIINKNFGIVFSEIFGGGHGYVKLSDESDVLNSGIEIAAQPPGKNIQNMTLLSGGERALTAIALLFAILKMKPSPFCILDEIEAALDDANVKRYADYLKKFSNDTQFIVITHRKGSMEAADALYGITMQEQGISKLISVKFTKS